jgi:hypothetical protein
VPHNLENKMLTIEEKLLAALNDLQQASTKSLAECVKVEIWSVKRVIRSMRKKRLIYICKWSVEGDFLAPVFTSGDRPDAAQPGATEVKEQKMVAQIWHARPDIAASWIKRKK